MQFLTLSVLFLGSLSISAEAASNFRLDDRIARSLQPRQKNNNNQLCINSNVLQTASEKTGQEPGTDGIKPGQAPSATDDANFINFCSGQTITNGAQLTDGSCNSIPMGKIPATKNMISAMIVNPQPGVQVTADQTFNISVQTAHLDAGFFVNPTTNYYTAPQDLNNNGDIIGHCHVTVQDIGSLKATTPPDPNKFAFFKGIDDAGNGQGLLQAVVTDGLPVGVYRVCTMIAARNHQPVNMPVAQRGAQDDCTKFEVVAASGNNGNNGNGNNGKSKDNAGTANVGKMETGKVDGQAKDENDTANATQNPSTSDGGQAGNANDQAGNGNANGNAGKSNGKAGKSNGKAGKSNGKAGNANVKGAAANPDASNGLNATDSSPTPTTSGSVTFGSCTNPAIEFGPGFDGRDQNSFQPVNKADFNHGSTKDIGTVASFICDRMNDSCKAGQESVDACKAAKAATEGKNGQAAADAFNTALGVGSSGASKFRNRSRLLSRRAMSGRTFYA